MTRKEALAYFLARATAHFDTPQIRKEAAELFDKKWAEAHRKDKDGN